ncbi:unnamed protein product, partial [Laminaria digitata]
TVVPPLLLQQQRQSFTQFCSLCNQPKPVRAHHCRVCVMKMDHHCRWVGRCVGKGNYKVNEYHRHVFFLFFFL